MLTVSVRLVFVSQRVPPATLYTHSVNECANKRKESKRASNKGRGRRERKAVMGRQKDDSNVERASASDNTACG